MDKLKYYIDSEDVEIETYYRLCAGDSITFLNNKYQTMTGFITQIYYNFDDINPNGTARIIGKWLRD